MADAPLHESTALAAPGPGAEPSARRSGRAAALLGALALCAGAVLVPVLFFQYLDVYLTFSGDTVEATPGEERRYLVTLVACVALLVAGTASAAVTGRRWRVGAGVVLLGVALVAGVLLRVSAADAGTAPPAPGPAGGQVACRSGGDSDECPGG